MLRVINAETWKEVKSGDVIKDFRGNDVIFVAPTRASTVKSGKVVVKDSNGNEHEYYDKVFNLIVEEVPENYKH